MSDSAEVSIRRFFRGRNVFVTGATGFLGKALVEKILRAIPEVENLLLLIRPKSGEGRSAEGRFEREILESPVFGRLRRIHGTEFEAFVRRKCVPVSGDLGCEGLGLVSESYRALASKVDVVLNSAATVSFDERLDIALSLNTLGAKRMAEFAVAAGADALVHVSTCYVNGTRTGDIPEQVFPLENLHASGSARQPLDLDAEVRDIQKTCRRIETESRSAGRQQRFLEKARETPHEAASVQELAEDLRQAWVRESLIRAGMERARRYGWNDTYTFTKALGEQMVLAHRGTIRTRIVRPAIIESSYTEPEPGWIDSLRMADPVIIAYGRGTLADFPGRPDIVLDVIPLDFVVNSVLAAAADAPTSSEPLVLQAATGERNPIDLRTLARYVHDYFQQIPMRDENGRAVQTQAWSFPSAPKFDRRLGRRSWCLGVALRILGHLRLFPFLTRQRQNLEATLSRLERIRYYSKIYAPYTALSCRYLTWNLRNLMRRLDREEARLFVFDPEELEWRHYICDVHIPGVKRHVLRMLPSESLPACEPLVGLPETAAEAHGEAATIADLYYRSVYRNPGKAAFQIRRSGQWHRFTYAESFLLTKHIRRELGEVGVGPHDRVILWAENQPEWVIGYLGVTTMGATAVPLDFLRPPEEVWEAARITDAKAVLTTSDRARRLRRAAPEPNDGFTPPVLLDLQSWGAPFGASPGSLADESLPSVDILPDQVASILFTSGTTLAPKGVPLTHRNLVSNVLSISQVIPPHVTDQFLSILPLHHALEFTCSLLMSLFGGCTITYLEALNAANILSMMQETGTTVVIGVPRLVELFWARIREQVPGPLRFALEPDDDLSGFRRTVAPVVRRFISRKVRSRFGGRIRVFVTGGAAIEPSIVRGFLRLGIPVCEGYGLTETSPVVTVNPLGEQRPGSVGTPLPDVEVRIDDPDDRGVGEILVRGPNVMAGYLGRDDLNRESFVDGWFRTRDLGSKDDRGYLRVSGREDDMIVTAAGKNVYPDEVEFLYGEIPGAKEYCVVGVRRSGRQGEEVHAVIAIEEGLGQDEEEALRRRISEYFEGFSKKLPTYQRVQSLHFWKQELPKTSTLKIRRGEVKKNLEDRLRGQGAPGAGTAWRSPVDRIVREALGRVLKTDGAAIQGADRLQLDLGLDSLARVDLTAELENSLSIRIPDESVETWETVDDLVSSLQDLTRKGSSGAD